MFVPEEYPNKHLRIVFRTHEDRDYDIFWSAVKAEIDDVKMFGEVEDRCEILVTPPQFEVPPDLIRAKNMDGDTGNESLKRSASLPNREEVNYYVITDDLTEALWLLFEYEPTTGDVWHINDSLTIKVGEDELCISYMEDTYVYEKEDASWLRLFLPGGMPIGNKTVKVQAKDSRMVEFMGVMVSYTTLREVAQSLFD